VNDTEPNVEGEAKKSRMVWANHPLDGRTLMLIAAIVCLGIFTFWNDASHQKQISSRASYYHEHDHEHGTALDIDCSRSRGYGDLTLYQTDPAYVEYENSSHDHSVSGAVDISLNINCWGSIR